MRDRPYPSGHSWRGQGRDGSSGALIVADRQAVGGMAASACRPVGFRARWSLLVAAGCLAAVAPAAGQPGSGGHFRAGSISWTRTEGNSVRFEVLSSWTRSYSGHRVRHRTASGALDDWRAAEGRIFLGDHVEVGGHIPPQLDFGDGAVGFLVVEVTDFSESGDWFSGFSVFEHAYTTPNNGWRIDTDAYGVETVSQGAPWAAKLSGCCRWDRLLNEANEPFTLKATFDLVLATASPGVRSLEFTTACDTLHEDSQIKCRLPGKGLDRHGPCHKVPFTTPTCGDARDADGLFVVGNVDGLHPQVTDMKIYDDGTILLRKDAGTKCPPLGQRTLALSVRDGRVAHINIKNPGTNCSASGDLTVSGGLGSGVAASFVSEGGKIKSVTLKTKGKNYREMPTITVPAIDPQNFPCTGVEFEAIPFETQANILVSSIQWHGRDCFDQLNGNSQRTCELDVFGTDVKYKGNVIPQWLEFPNMGWGWDGASNRLIPPATEIDVGLSTAPKNFVFDGGTGKQSVHSHMVAYAGYPLDMTFKAFANWCQSDLDMSIDAERINDERCIVKGTTVTFKFGPLVFSHGPKFIEFSTHRQGAITDLLITYDNPFEAHRPNHEWAMNKLSRDYANHPDSVQAVSLGFTRIDHNLNAGAGGASVYLWYKTYDGNASNAEGQEAITHMNVSTSASEEAILQAEGYEKLDGNLNEGAGGSDVFIWYKRSSGHVQYQQHRPTFIGWELAITNISFASPQTPQTQFESQFLSDDHIDQNPYSNETHQGSAGEGSSSGWTKVDKDLNAGLMTNQPVFLYWRRSHSNPTTQSMSWTPCACDVGRQYICVAPQTSQMDAATHDRVTGEERCIAIDVMPDALPEWHSPQPGQVLEFFMGRETRYPITVVVLNPQKQVNIDAELPVGAALDILTEPSQNCSTTELGLCYGKSRDLVWTPAWNQGGLSTAVCFRASDVLTGCEPAGQAHESEVCVTLEVKRCVYAVNFEQHLQEMASVYKTDWLNLYSMNPTIKTPDRLLFEGQLVNIGHLYNVVPGDTVSKIAKVFVCFAGRLCP